MTAVKREVVYSLGKQIGLGEIIPVATYACYTDAHADGLTLAKPFHMRIERHVIPGSVVVKPEPSKFEWSSDDVEVEES